MIGRSASKINSERTVKVSSGNGAPGSIIDSSTNGDSSAPIKVKIHTKPKLDTGHTKANSKMTRFTTATNNTVDSVSLAKYANVSSPLQPPDLSAPQRSSARNGARKSSKPKVLISDLDDDEKQKVYNLIEKLVTITNEHEFAVSELSNERSRYANEIENINSSFNSQLTIIDDRLSLKDDNILELETKNTVLLTMLALYQTKLKNLTELLRFANKNEQEATHKIQSLQYDVQQFQEITKSQKSSLESIEKSRLFSEQQKQEFEQLQTQYQTLKALHDTTVLSNKTTAKALSEREAALQQERQQSRDLLHKNAELQHTINALNLQIAKQQLAHQQALTNIQQQQREQSQRELEMFQNNNRHSNNSNINSNRHQNVTTNGTTAANTATTEEAISAATAEKQSLRLTFAHAQAVVDDAASTHTSSPLFRHMQQPQPQSSPMQLFPDPYLPVITAASGANTSLNTIQPAQVVQHNSDQQHHNHDNNEAEEDEDDDHMDDISLPSYDFVSQHDMLQSVVNDYSATTATTAAVSEHSSSSAAQQKMTQHNSTTNSITNSVPAVAAAYSAMFSPARPGDHQQQQNHPHMEHQHQHLGQQQQAQTYGQRTEYLNHSHESFEAHQSSPPPVSQRQSLQAHIVESPVHTKKTKKAQKKVAKDVNHNSSIGGVSKNAKSALSQSLLNTSVTSLISSASSRNGGSVVHSSMDSGSFNRSAERSAVKAGKINKSKVHATVSSGHSKQPSISNYSVKATSSSSGGGGGGGGVVVIGKTKTHGSHSISVSNSLPLHYFNHEPNPTTSGHANRDHGGTKSSGSGGSGKSAKVAGPITSGKGSVINNSGSSNSSGRVVGGGEIMYDSSLFDMLDI